MLVLVPSISHGPPRPVGRGATLRSSLFTQPCGPARAGQLLHIARLKT
jgi:hypothetical protein